MSNKLPVRYQLQDLMSMPLPPNPAKIHRASKMIEGKWVDIGPTGMYGATGMP